DWSSDVCSSDLTGIVDANSNYVQEAFKRLDFLVVQDLFFTTTAKYADVVLPAVPSLEKDGTFTNTERRIQRLYQALDPVGEAKPAWLILTELAAKMDHEWGYTHPSDIMDEAAALNPSCPGVSYTRLAGDARSQWPVHKDGTDSPLLYVDGFPFPDGKARLYPLDFDFDYDTSDKYDLHVNNGRVLEHFHEGNMTYKSPGLKDKLPTTFLEVAPDL